MPKKPSISPSSSELPLRDIDWTMQWFLSQAWNCWYCKSWSVWKIKPLVSDACLNMSKVCLRLGLRDKCGRSGLALMVLRMKVMLTLSSCANSVTAWAIFTVCGSWSAGRLRRSFFTNSFSTVSFKFCWRKRWISCFNHSISESCLVMGRSLTTLYPFSKYWRSYLVKIPLFFSPRSSATW